MSIGSPPHNVLPAGTPSQMEPTHQGMSLAESHLAWRYSWGKEESPARIIIETDGCRWWPVRPAVPAQSC